MSSPIRIDEVLRELPHFDTFASVEKLLALVERLRGDERFTITVAGTSVNGVPIHHVRFGRGAVKVLLVAFPDCMEPIGGLTVYSVLTLLAERNAALLAADVEWHIVPCIDPDGAIQNERWTQQPFSIERFVKGYFVQARSEQVDNSFPISHKKLVWTQPSREAAVLKEILDRVRPDFFFSLHNAWTGGAFYFVSRDIGPRCYERLHRFLERERFPLQRRPMWKEVCPQFAEGVVELYSVRKYYDCLEKTPLAPESVLTCGAGSWDYLAQIHPAAVTFVAELGYALHPQEGSHKSTGQDLRHFKLRIDADSKYLGTVLLEEWEKVRHDVDRRHPIYRAVVSGRVFPLRDKLAEGPMPLSRYPTRDILFNPEYSRTMTEDDRLNACIADGGLFFLFFSYQFVRLLKESKPTSAIRHSIERLERLYEQALAELDRYIDFKAFRVVECDTLARIQLGSGLIALNTLLEAAV
jgi:hypothetical protein